MLKKVCTIEGCSRPYHAKGMCDFHYRRKLRGESLDTPSRTEIGVLRKIYPNEYNLWKAMNQRCCNKNNRSYSRYGGRGIFVCSRWKGHSGFKNFISDMGERPVGKFENGYAKYSIDRIDNDKGYCPENCRWADRHTQRTNQNRVKEYTINGVRGSWTELYNSFHPKGLKEKTAWRRHFQLGWSVEEAILTPVS